MVELFANSGGPDQTPRFAASDLGLHCLPVTRLRVSSLQRVKYLKNEPSLMLVLRFLSFSQTPISRSTSRCQSEFV